MIYYFAYGSNLHPMRLMERVPSAELVGVAKLNGYRLTFHKKSIDGSSKCNIFETKSDEDCVHGAVYQINSEHKDDLDKFEGKGSGYIDSQLTLECNNAEYLCFTYLAQQSHIADNLVPYHWYKEMVVLGAKYLQFPELYIQNINSISSAGDPDAARSAEKDALLRKIKEYV